MQTRTAGSKHLPIFRWVSAVTVFVLIAFGAQAQEPVKVPAAEAAKLLIQPVPRPYNPLKAAHVTGVVHLEIVVDVKGAVTDVKDLDNTPTDGHNPKGILAKSAMDTVHQYHYHPYLVNGQPAAMRTTVDVTFDR